jgi:hypothetical protein
VLDGAPVPEHGRVLSVSIVLDVAKPFPSGVRERGPRRRRPTSTTSSLLQMRAQTTGQLAVDALRVRKAPTPSGLGDHRYADDERR